MRTKTQKGSSLVVTIYILIAIVITAIFSLYCSMPETGDPIPIESASMSQGIEGSFGIFAGSIESEPYYFFYTPKGGGLTLEKAPAERVTIIETGEKDPQYIPYKCSEGGKLYVPDGTVIKDYHVKQPGLNGDTR